MALKKRKETPLPPSPPNSDVLINQGMTSDEVIVRIDVYGAKLNIEGSSFAHVKYAAMCLGEILGVDKAN